MGKGQRLQHSKGLRQFDPTLSVKIPHRAPEECIEHTDAGRSGSGLDSEAQALLECIERMGRISTGGNSVEDIRAERER